MPESHEQFLERLDIPRKKEEGKEGRLPSSWGENWYQELVSVAITYVNEEFNTATIVKMMVDHYGVDEETARRAVEDARGFLRGARRSA